MRNQIWFTGDIRVALDGAGIGDDPSFVGHALSGRDYWSWEAWPTAYGYRVTIRSNTDRVYTWSGVTFNLGLEVIAAIKRNSL